MEICFSFLNTGGLPALVVTLTRPEPFFAFQKTTSKACWGSQEFSQRAGFRGLLGENVHKTIGKSKDSLIVSWAS